MVDKPAEHREPAREVLMRCPECGSEDFVTWPYYFGMDQETGNPDEGVRACCRNCGHEADVEDFQGEKYGV